MPAIGPFTVFFAFLGLKLSHVVDWSWWAVTAPLWVAGFVLLVVAAITIAGFSMMRRS